MRRCQASDADPEAQIRAVRAVRAVLADIDALGVLEQRLPSPDVEMWVLLPYTRGDLVTRVHETAEALGTEHTAVGTLLHARVHPGLAAALEPFSCAAGVT